MTKSGLVKSGSSEFDVFEVLEGNSKTKLSVTTTPTTYSLFIWKNFD
jgi:hypothetical protein